MPVQQGVFGAPVWMPDKPNVLGSFAAMRSMAREDEKLELAKQQAASLDEYRGTLAQVKQQGAQAAELAALVRMAQQEPEAATEFLNSRQDLLASYGLKPGQIEFQGSAKNLTVATNKVTGDVFAIDPLQRDPAKTIRKVGNVGGTPLSREQVLGMVLQGMPEADQREAALGGGKGGRGGKRTEGDIKAEILDTYLAKGIKGLTPRQRVLFNKYKGTDPNFKAALDATEFEDGAFNRTPEERAARAAAVARGMAEARDAELAAADEEEDGTGGGAADFDTFMRDFGLADDEEE